MALHRSIPVTKSGDTWECSICTRISPNGLQTDLMVFQACLISWTRHSPLLRHAFLFSFRFVVFKTKITFATMVQASHKNAKDECWWAHFKVSRKSGFSEVLNLIFLIFAKSLILYFLNKNVSILKYRSDKWKDFPTNVRVDDESHWLFKKY